MSKSRDARIEWIKLIAIFAVVFQHLSHSDNLWVVTRLTHGAVPAFALLSVFFAVRAGLRAERFWSWLGSRFVRLYGLFLVWNIVYFLIRMLASRSGAPTSFKGFAADSFFLIGYDNALWFIPFIIIANSVGFSIAFGVRRWPRTAVIGVACLLAGAAVVLATSSAFGSLKLENVMLGLSRKAVPAGLIGMALGLLGSELDSFCYTGRWSRIVYAGLFLGSWYLLVTVGRGTFLPETLLALTGVSLALRLIPQAAVAVNPDYTLFIYVSHSLFLHGLRKGMFFLGYDWEELSALPNLVGMVVLSVAISGTFLLIRKNFLGDVALFRVQGARARAVAKVA